MQKEHYNKEQEELEVDLQCERLYSSQNTVVEVCVFNIPNGPTLLYSVRQPNLAREQARQGQEPKSQTPVPLLYSIVDL